MEDIYFEALQSLSASRWILYESMTLDKPEDFGELKESWVSLLSGLIWKDICAKGAIQVTGPAGYGKSALVKLISLEIKQRSPVITIDNFLSSYGRTRPSLYDVCVCFVHQILSQPPSLFPRVQKPMTEIPHQETWTEESLWILLTTILQRSRSIDFLIVIYNFQDWPSEIRSWWSDNLSSFMKACGLSFAFLTSSHLPISHLPTLPSFVLDVKTGYGQRRDDLVKAKTKNFLGRAYSPGIFAEGLSDDVQKEIMSRAKSFQGSFMALNTYLARLFQNFALTNSVRPSPSIWTNLA